MCRVCGISPCESDTADIITNSRITMKREFRAFEHDVTVSWWSRWWRATVPGFAVASTMWGGMVTPEMFQDIPLPKSHKPAKPKKSGPGWFARNRGDMWEIGIICLIPAPVVVTLFLLMFGVL